MIVDEADRGFACEGELMSSQVTTERRRELGSRNRFGTLLPELLETSLGFAFEFTAAAGQLLRHFTEALILRFHFPKIVGELTDASLAFIKSAPLGLGFEFEFLDLLSQRHKISRTCAVVRPCQCERQTQSAHEHQPRQPEGF